jgi:hypothetical protein
MAWNSFPSLFKRKGGHEKPRRTPERTRVDVGILEGDVVTQFDLVRAAYREIFGDQVQPIATDRFINVSKTKYGSAWLAREIGQNFVDHNPKAPFTLDGVDFKEEKLSDKKIRFSIRGHWRLKDNTGLIGLHSDKPTDKKNAGGNGIGLKQVVLRYLRDFGDTSVQVQGDEWHVSYVFGKAAELNKEVKRKLAERNLSPAGEINNDWLGAKLSRTKSCPYVEYVIETDNSEVIGSLRTLKTEVTVSAENPFLKDADFSNEHGAIKWFPPDKKGKVSDGRLYINGQVFNYQDEPKEGKGGRVPTV